MGEQPHLKEGNSPLVTVVIPCYNQAHFLGEAIESVLSQSYPNFEVIVVDDGSTDNTSEVASRYEGVRLVRQENRGLAGARNTGIGHSRGGVPGVSGRRRQAAPWSSRGGARVLRGSPRVRACCRLPHSNRGRWISLWPGATCWQRTPTASSTSHRGRHLSNHPEPQVPHHPRNGDVPALRLRERWILRSRGESLRRL